MAYDLKVSHSSTKYSRMLAPGTVVLQEGCLLCSTLVSGVEQASLVATPVGTEKVIGWAITADSLPTQTAYVDIVTVPASGSLIVGLSNANLVTGSVYALDQTTNTPYTVSYTFAGTPPSGQVNVDITTGQLKFNAAQAGDTVQVTYLYYLTVTMAQQIFGQRFFNNQYLEQIYNQITIGAGEGELYTDQFDTSQNWAGGAPITLGPNGTLTIGGAGPVLDAVVVNVPNENQPMLGIRFTFTPSGA
jgi:hypothetical protein